MRVYDYHAMVEALVAGHICLDIIPELHSLVTFEPGRLVEAGPAKLSTGGAVSNTGLALTKLGLNTRLLGKVGNGAFSRAVRHILDEHQPGLSDSIVVTPGQSTSYTIVINLSGQDRMFLHYPGANGKFTADDVPAESLVDTKLMHFGYPPLMERMYADDGAELERLFQRAKAANATTSLDMSLPDPESPSGQADWLTILKRVLPYVDIFVPSIEELLYMLDRATFDRLRGAVMGHVPSAIYRKLAEQSIALGAKIVAIKAGTRGLYVRTSGSLEGMGRGAPANPGEWIDQELWSPCFKVETQGTTGAGDATIAGFLMGLLRGMSPTECAIAGTATGAFCCERPDALSGIRSWEETRARVEAGWDTLSPDLNKDWVRTDHVWVRG